MKHIRFLVGLMAIVGGCLVASCSNELVVEESSETLVSARSGEVPAGAVDVSTVNKLEAGGVYVINGNYYGSLPASDGGIESDIIELYVAGTWYITRNITLPVYTDLFVVDGGTVRCDAAFTLTASIGCNVTIYEGGTFKFSALLLGDATFAFVNAANGFFTNNGTMDVDAMKMGYSSFLNNATGSATIDDYTFPLTPGGTLNYGTLIIDGEVQRIGIVVPDDGGSSLFNVTIPLVINSPEELSMLNGLILDSPIYSLLESTISLLETLGLAIFPNREISVTAFGVEGGLIISNIGLDLTAWGFEFSQAAINAAMTETSTNVLIQIELIEEILTLTLSLTLAYNL